MEKEEKKALYEKAKKAYYEGSPIMEDIEFDELEAEIGLENKSYIGGGSTPSYTIPHPYIMGSLSKIQIKLDEYDSVNWFKYADQVISYLGKADCSRPLVPCIITPKFDGCSFEYYFNNGSITISSRGDGNYGKDLHDHLGGRLAKVQEYMSKKADGTDEYTLRGEVLIDKNTFLSKYSEFTNPRSFVSGILNRKYEDIKDKDILKDLSVIIYDYRTRENGAWLDRDWTELVGILPEWMLPEFHKEIEYDGADCLRKIYKEFEDYRSEYRFALDGIVIKPSAPYRNVNLDRERPDDCVAIKFLPMIEETTVRGIEWQLGKTGEYTPVVIFDEIVLDGKKVNKASGHNYGNVVDNKIHVGSVISVSLAGDIIPFIYKVVSTSGEEEYNLPDNSYIDGCHLMKELNLVEKMEMNFMASCKSLNITGLGDSLAHKIFDYLEYKVEHIFYVYDDKIRDALYSGEGKVAENIVEAIHAAKQKKTLADVIASMNIQDCGQKCAEQCARYIVNKESADFSGLSNVGWQWVVDAMEDDNNPTMFRLKALLRYKDGSESGHEFDKYISMYRKENESGDVIKVILTGSPSHYKNKKDFLEQHKEFSETGKWSECQILFTGDMSSTSSKMEKARKLGIEIREY